MDFKLSEQQLMYKQEVFDFARNVLNTNTDSDSFSGEQWNKVAEFGLLGVTIDEKYGGLGENNLTAATIFEELGYACDDNGLIFAINNHIWVCENMIFLHGSNQLKDKYLYDMVKGKKIGAIAITEVDAGSDALSMKTYAMEKGDYFILNGNKMFVSNATVADVFLVIAVTNQERCKKFTAFIVEKNFEGIEIGQDIPRMGLASCPMAEVIFKDCKVPRENVLGRLNMGDLILMSALEWERFYEFVPHVGRMKRLMEMCIEHVNERKQFNKRISEFQAVSHKIADMQVSIEMAENLLFKIAWLKDNKKNAFKETSIFKLYVSENYIKVCREALQLFGAYGYTKEYPLERELRDALACSIYSGTNEIQKNNIYNSVSMTSNKNRNK